MKKEKLFKNYSCPFCQLTSTRKYNLDVHIIRKHPQQQSQKEIYLPYSFTNLYQYNEHLHGESISQIDSGNALHESTSVQSFPSPFLENSYFKYLEKQQKLERLERRAKQRKFYQTINKIRNFMASFNTNIIDIPIPYYQLPFDNPSTQIPLNWSNNSTNIKNPINSKLTIEPSIKMPCAHKIYKCKMCSTEILLPIFDFDDIIEEEKFQHKCGNHSFTSQYHNEKMMDQNVDHYYHSKNILDLLLSIINSRINSQKIILETVVLPDILIQNPICFFILEIITNVFGLNLIPNQVFKILKSEKFIDLGEIDSKHWACRSYDSQNDIELEKEELQDVLRTLNATFAFLTFEIDHHKKFIFCYIPLTNKSNSR